MLNLHQTVGSICLRKFLGCIFLRSRCFYVIPIALSCINDVEVKVVTIRYMGMLGVNNYLLVGESSALFVNGSDPTCCGRES